MLTLLQLNSVVAQKQAQTLHKRENGLCSNKLYLWTLAFELYIILHVMSCCSSFDFYSTI